VDAEQQTTHAHAQSRDTDASIRGNTAPVASASVSDHGARSDARLALIFAVSAVVVSLVLMLFCYGLWNRYELLKINYSDLKAAMILHGMNPHPHMPGESP
jgi:hypothetical protein